MVATQSSLQKCLTLLSFHHFLTVFQSGFIPFINQLSLVNPRQVNGYFHITKNLSLLWMDGEYGVCCKCFLKRLKVLCLPMDGFCLEI